MSEQIPEKQEKIHSGGQVLFRLLIFVLAIIAIVILFKLVAM